MFNLVKKRSKEEEDLERSRRSCHCVNTYSWKYTTSYFIQAEFVAQQEKLVETLLCVQSNCEAALRASKYRDVGAFTGKIGIPLTIAANTRERASSWPCFLSRGGKSGFESSPRYESFLSSCFRAVSMLCDSQFTIDSHKMWYISIDVIRDPFPSFTLACSSRKKRRKIKYRTWIYLKMAAGIRDK